MITCTVDYDNYGDVTVMLTDTSYSGGFARIDAHKNDVEYLVRYNSGVTSSDVIENYHHVTEALQQAVYEIADLLAFNASDNNSNCDYDTVYTRLRKTLEFELNLC